MKQVLVELSSVQVNLFDAEAVGKAGSPCSKLLGSEGEEEEFLSFTEGEEEIQGKVIKEWKFDAG